MAARSLIRSPFTILCSAVVAPLLAFTAGLYAQAAGGEEAVPAKTRNPQAVDEVNAGARKAASAAWWGFNAEDSTEALQAAIDSGVPKLTVPFMGAPWIVRPIKLHSNQEIVFEPGVMVLAKRGEFKGGGDSLFTGVELDDVTLRGYGATFRMWKKDYQSADYKKAEWRMGLAIRGCNRFRVEGVRIESSGGDGVYVDGAGSRKCSQDITIRDVTCYDNHRQGMSIVSAANLLIENCVMANTSGTPPEAGIDFEPDTADQRIANCVVRNCVMENNSGHEILVYLKPLTAQSEPVSLTFENCVSRMGAPGMTPEDFKDMSMKGWSGMSVGAVNDDGPKGLIEFRNCVSENTGKEGAKVYDKSADSVQVRFVNCSWKNPWLARAREDGGPRVPVLVHLRRPSITHKLGGVEFVDCHVYDDINRPALQAYFDEEDTGVQGLKGNITVHTAGAARMKLGPGATNNTVTVTKAVE